MIANQGSDLGLMSLLFSFCVVIGALALVLLVVSFVCQAKGDKTARPFLLGSAAALLLCSFLLPVSIHSEGFDYSNGQRVGYITKISKKGLIWKTWEGEMQVGGLTDQGGTFASNTWSFSVTDDKIAQAIQDAMLSGKRIKVVYHEYAARGLAKGSTGYDIKSVEVAQ